METDNLKPSPDEIEEPISSTLDLDKVLVEEVGQFGRYQVKLIALTMSIAMFLSWATTEYMFTAARITTRCLIPECENSSEQLQFAPLWLQNAIPRTSNTSFDNCHRFRISSDAGNTSIDNRCPATLFDQNSSIPCEEYVYENTNTMVYDLRLACDEWRRSLIGSARTLGTMVGLPLTGFISDRWGRRTALTINGFNMACIGIARYWVNSYTGILASEFLEANLGGGIYSCAYILLMEIVGPRYRVMTSSMLSTIFAVGHCVLGIFSWAVPNWRLLTLLIYVPQVALTFYFWLMSESVRWYISKGHYEKATKVLQDIAKTNGTQLSEKSLQILRQGAKKEITEKCSKNKNDKEWLIVQVFRHKPVLMLCLVSPVWWITFTFIYYGLNINSVNMPGGKYVNYLAVSAFEIPGYWIAYALLGRIGRKPVNIGAYWICAVSQIGYALMPEGHRWLSLTIYLIGKCSISVVAVSLYIYTTEMYPTEYRHTLFAFSSMTGRLGAVIAPLTPAFGGKLPFVLFAGCALASGLLMLLTPETLGSKLPDTMEEAARIGKKRDNGVSSQDL